MVGWGGDWVEGWANKHLVCPKSKPNIRITKAVVFVSKESVSLRFR